MNGLNDLVRKLLSVYVYKALHLHVHGSLFTKSLFVTGPDTLPAVCCRDFLTAVHKKTPHSWNSHTLKSFPPVFAEFYEQNPVQREDKSQLKRNVETEYRKWKSKRCFLWIHLVLLAIIWIHFISKPYLFK